MNDGTITNTLIVFNKKYFFKYFFLYNKTKHHLSLRCSPNNSEVEEEEEEEREDEEREGESIVLEEKARLVFGDGNSYDK